MFNAAANFLGETAHLPENRPPSVRSNSTSSTTPSSTAFVPPNCSRKAAARPANLIQVESANGLDLTPPQRIHFAPEPNPRNDSPVAEAGELFLSLPSSVRSYVPPPGLTPPGEDDRQIGGTSNKMSNPNDLVPYSFSPTPSGDLGRNNRAQTRTAPPMSNMSTLSAAPPTRIVNKVPSTKSKMLIALGLKQAKNSQPTAAPRSTYLSNALDQRRSPLGHSSGRENVEQRQHSVVTPAGLQAAYIPSLPPSSPLRNSFSMSRQEVSRFNEQEELARRRDLEAYEARTSGVPTTSTTYHAHNPTANRKDKMNMFVENVKEKGKKVYASIKKRLNSKSDPAELPKTWAEYDEKYANHEIDVNDPPLPPQREEILPSGEQNPYASRVYVAPKPENEAGRQRVVNKLDLFGTKNPTQATESHRIGTSIASSSRPESVQSSLLPNSARRNSFDQSSIGESATAADTALTMENHPAFRDIVAKCREMFDSKVGMLTVLDDEQQLFLATGGLPEGVNSLPRAVTFCSHAILGGEAGEDGMVVLNTQDDWRFANNMPSTALGARFYAGVPLYAPTFGDPNAPNVPIGTLCVADDKPRQDFTAEQVDVLRDLAAQASHEVENWVNERMTSKLNKLENLFQSSSISLPNPPPQQIPQQQGSRRPSKMNSSITTASAFAPPTLQLPDTPPLSFRGTRSTHSREDSETSSAHFQPARSNTRRTFNPTPSIRQTAQSSYTSNPAQSSSLSLATTFEAPVTAIPKDLQKVFDQATKMLNKALDLNLVYLVALDFTAAQNSPATLRILSAHGLNYPAPAFDPALHVKALRAAEGGLLYRNPSFEPTEDAVGYASGILIPVLEVRRVGYVLAGYTKHTERTFQEKDLKYFTKFAEQLESYVMRLGKGGAPSVRSMEI